MTTNSLQVVVISHASIKQINRSVYRIVKNSVAKLTIVAPESLALSSGMEIQAEAPFPGDPPIVNLKLVGRNPRTYYYPELINTLNELQPHIVLLENDPVSRLGATLSRWCRRRGVKLICQTYENLKRDFSTTIRNQGLKAIPKNFLIHVLNYSMASRIDALLVVNRDSYDIFKAYGYKKIVKIPLGYDRKVFFPDPSDAMAYRNLLGITPDTVLIAYFGRMVRQKGIHILIHALKDLPDLNWKLLLDNKHDSQHAYATEIEDLLAAASMNDRVLYFEADHFQIAHYMRAVDIVVAPSITTKDFKEQYGRAVQEAMACGCTCVVSDSGHLKDLVQERSLVFPEGDSQALSILLRPLIIDRGKRREYETILSERAAKNFTTESQAQALLELFESLMPGK